MTDILIVEDNEELADILCDFLRAENYLLPKLVKKHCRCMKNTAHGLLCLT